MTWFLDGGYVYIPETGAIITIFFHRDQLKITTDEVIRLLGEPDIEGVSEMDGFHYMNYSFGNHNLEVSYNNDGGYETLSFK